MLLKILVILSLQYIGQTLSCQQFDPKKIKLITFDVYAALFNLGDSLDKNIKQVLSVVDEQSVQRFTDCWIEFYGDSSEADPSHFENPFEDYLTVGIYKCAQQTSEKIKRILNQEVIRKLLLTWTQLEPWPQTIRALEQLQAKGYKLAVLSNGSEKSLRELVNNKLKTVKIQYVFGSTQPKRFKPNAGIYRQITTQGFNIQEILHVAGGSIDVVGARTYGLFTGFNQIIDKTHKFTKDTEPCIWLKNLSELPNKFE